MSAVQHMVMVKFKPDVSNEKAMELLNSVFALKDIIPGITHCAGGPYSSPEGMNRGYTHGFVMTFDSAEARDVYLPHPEHEKVKEGIFPHLDEAVAFDFVVE